MNLVKEGLQKKINMIFRIFIHEIETEHFYQDIIISYLFPTNTRGLPTIVYLFPQWVQLIWSPSKRIHCPDHLIHPVHFFISCINWSDIPLFIRELLLFVLFFSGIVLSLLFFHLADQSWGHWPLEAFSCLSKTPPPSHASSIASYTSNFPRWRAPSYVRLFLVLQRSWCCTSVWSRENKGEKVMREDWPGLGVRREGASRSMIAAKGRDWTVNCCYCFRVVDKI